MAKWEMVSFGDLGLFQSGGTPSSNKPEYFDGVHPWITTPALGPTYIDASCANAYLTCEAIKNSATKIIPANSLLIGVRVGVGKASINTVPMCTNQDIVSLSVFDSSKVSIEYLHKFIQTQQNYLCNQKRGSTIKGIKTVTLKRLVVPLPPLPVQQKIADALDRASAPIKKRKAQIAKLDLLIKSQFVEMFGDPVRNEKEWEVKRLGEVVKARSSKRVYQREQTDDGVPFLRVSDLTSKILDGVDTCDLYISEELYESFMDSGLVPKSGDILVTSRGTLGLSYIVSDFDRFYFQDGMISWLDKRNSDVNSLYLSFLFQTDMIKRQIERVSAGSTVSYLSLGNIKNFEILLPPLPLQTRFADFVRHADKSKILLQQSLANLERNYKSIMQKCFRGEIF